MSWTDMQRDRAAARVCEIEEEGKRKWKTRERRIKELTEKKKTYFDRENKRKPLVPRKQRAWHRKKGKQKKSSSSSKCPYQKKCGGCTYLNLSYEEQLAKKRAVPEEDSEGHRPGQRHGWHGKSLSLPE